MNKHFIDIIKKLKGTRFSRKMKSTNPKRVSNIEPFLNLYNQRSIEYPTGLDKINFNLFANNNSEIALIMLCVDVNVEIFQSGGEIYAFI